MHLIRKKKAEKTGQESATHLPTALWQQGFKLDLFSHPSISSFPASCHSLAQPGSWEARQPACSTHRLPANTALLQSFLYARTECVCTPPLHMEPLFAKIRSELDVSGEIKLTPRLVFELQQPR